MRAQWDVIIAENASIGYNLVFEHAPDLILSDILMENLTGYQLCRLLKNNPLTKKIPVVLLTILDEKIDKFWSQEAGAQEFISKNSDFTTITESCAKIVEQYPMSEEYKEELRKNNTVNTSLQNQLNSILDDALMQSTVMNEFRNLTGYLGDDEVFIENMFKLLKSILDFNVGFLFLNPIDNKDNAEVFVDALNSNFSEKTIKSTVKKTLIDNSITGELLANAQIKYKFNDTIEKSKQNIGDFASKFVLPLQFEDEFLGLLVLNNETDFDYSKFKFIDLIASELMLIMKIKKLYKQTKHLSIIDPLTGLLNRRSFESHFEREFSRAQRYGSELSIAIIDLDYFKTVNDNYGHQTGDFILEEFSKIAAKMFRTTDLIFRYGGEEILIILPQTTSKRAFIPVERLREKIQEQDFVFEGKKLKITISAGISDNRNCPEAKEDLIKNADSSLYEAKSKGRNRVSIYGQQ